MIHSGLGNMSHSDQDFWNIGESRTTPEMYIGWYED